MLRKEVFIECLDTGTDCWEGLWSLHLWWYSRDDWTRHWEPM